jgi:hypothetical protein
MMKTQEMRTVTFSPDRVHEFAQVHRHWTDDADRPTEKLMNSAGKDQEHDV